MELIKRITALVIMLGIMQNTVTIMASEPLGNPFGDSAVIYVAPNGSDSSGDGSIDRPFATMEAARNKVRNTKSEKDIYVVFRGGEYDFKNTVELGVADSGKNGNKVIYTSYPGEEAVFNGGIRIFGWNFYENGIYVADVPEAENFRELYVDGIRQTRAGTKMIQGMGFDENQTSLKVLTSDLPENIKNQDCLETMNTYNWRQYWLPVEYLFREGNYTKIFYDSKPMQIYTSKFNFEWKGETFFRLENALEFLDEEGEWYFDKYEKKLYYKPFEDTDISKSEIYVPVTEKFIDIKGDSIDNPVENIEIRNIKFLYGGWVYPAEEGYCSVQATSMVGSSGAHAAMTPGHVEVNFAKNIVFSGNTMAHMAVTGINAENGVKETNISGNVFYDTGASAVTVGSTKHTAAARIIEVPDKVSTNNNIIRYAGNSFYGAPGITYYYTTNSEIVHNDIQNTTYSGISIGWGWSHTTIQHDNLVGYNKIGNVNTKVIDGAGIYSLSRNMNSGYVGNYVFAVNAPFNSAALYHDEKSCGFEDYDNVVDADNPSFLFYNLNNNDKIIIRDSYTNTLNIINYKGQGKDIQVYNIHYVKNDEWPERAIEIMNASGPEKEYCDEVYTKLKAVEKPAGEPKPVIRGVDIDYLEANQFTPLHHTAPKKEDVRLPYKEENGSVVFDAIDINGEYIGYDRSKRAFIGVLQNTNWVGKYSARAAITIQACQYNIENADSLTEKPSVGYKVYFSTPGKYYVFAKARVGAEIADAMTVYLNDKEVGKLSVHKSFSWCGKNSTGDLTVDIKEAGIYEIKFETMRDVYMDRIWLTQNPPEELYDKSVISGPIASVRYSDSISYANVPIKLTSDNKPAELVKRTNIALNKPATASSYLTQSPGYPPKNAVNGNFVDDWLTEETKEAPWWQVDLEKEYKISEIGLVFRTSANQAATRRNFEVLASNDPEFGKYTKLYSSGSLTVGFKEELSIPVELDEVFRYVRVRKTGKESFGIAECRIYSEANGVFDTSEAYFSSDKKGKYGVLSALDGDLSTSWCEGLKENYRVKFRNKTGKSVSKIQLYIRNDVNIPELYENFEIRASNDFNFENYVVLTSNFLREGHTLTATAKDPNSYEYIMIIKKKGFIGLSEVKISTRGENLEGKETEETE